MIDQTPRMFGEHSDDRSHRAIAAQIAHDVSSGAVPDYPVPYLLAGMIHACLAIVDELAD